MGIGKTNLYAVRTISTPPSVDNLVKINDDIFAASTGPAWSGLFNSRKIHEVTKITPDDQVETVYASFKDDVPMMSSAIISDDFALIGSPFWNMFICSK